MATPCRKCSGRGIVRNTVRRTIEIPAGVDEGTQIRLAGEGEPGVGGGPNGNLYVLLHVRSHRHFRRHDTDLILELGINLAQAVLGAKIEIPTLDGPATLTVPAGTQTGDVLKVKGRGVPRLQASGRGDLLAVMTVEVPSRLNSKQKALVEELGRSLPPEPHIQEPGFLEKVRQLLGGLVD